MIQKRLICGLMISVSETGPDHKTMPHWQFWQVDNGGVKALAQGYKAKPEEALQIAKDAAKAVLARSMAEIDALSLG